MQAPLPKRVPLLRKNHDDGRRSPVPTPVLQRIFRSSLFSLRQQAEVCDQPSAGDARQVLTPLPRNPREGPFFFPSQAVWCKGDVGGQSPPPFFRT